jgi:hypothetical protein
LASAAQQAAPAPGLPAPQKPASAEFLRLADEVLADVSRLIALPQKFPLKKSVRTREEIRTFVVNEIKAEREPEKWYADQKALERFGLIPRNFPLEEFLIDLLTEQIAGLYDPKSQEFYIADWIGPDELRMVMAHELVHALQDQHFKVDVWLKAARPNDDAMSARHAVLEGAAIAGMLDYALREQNLSTRDLPNLEALIRAQMIGELEKNSRMARAPAFVRDSLLFPYLAGTTFSQQVLKAGQGWSDFSRVFERPPDSTRQVLHPELYLQGIPTKTVTLPDASAMPGSPWKRLDVNTLGEFGFHSILKEFAGEARALQLSPAWRADRYAIYEHPRSGQTLLAFRLRLASEADAARFFGSYSEILEKKLPHRSHLFRRPNFFSFETPEGGVFLYCHAGDCLSLEGGSRELFDRHVRELGWPAVPAPPRKAVTRIAALAPPGLLLPDVLRRPFSGECCY